MTLAAWAAASSSAGWNVAGRSTPARAAASYWKRLAWIGSISSRGPNGSRSDVGAERFTATRYSSWVGKATAPCGSASQISAEQRGELVGPLVRVRADDRRREPRSQAERLAAVIHRDHGHVRAPRASGSPRARSRTSTRARSPPAATRSRPARDGSDRCGKAGSPRAFLHDSERSDAALACRVRAGRLGTLCAVSELGKTTDVLVVGAGGAGLSAAWSARRSGADVLHVTKGSKASCNTAKAQGGIQAAVGDDDSPDQHASDIVASSHDTADPALAGVLADEAPDAIAWLEELGVGFSREGDGYRLARCGGAIAPAAPPGGRPHGPRHRDGAAKGARRRRRPDPRPHRARRPRAHERPLPGRARSGRREPSTSTPEP